MIRRLLLFLIIGLSGVGKAFTLESTRLNGQQLLGFPLAEQELIINPCLDQHLLKDRFGETAIVLAEQQLKRLPPQFCQTKEVLRQWVEWQYYASLLLANTEHPFIIGQQIAQENERLRVCTEVTCLAKQLPSMLAWLQKNVEENLLHSQEIASVSIEAAKISHPHLALRGLHLPLTQQKETCGSTDISALRFASSPLVVASRAVAVVRCQRPDSSGIWVLEKKSNQAWREIVALPSVENLFILPHSRELYPHIFYTQQTQGRHKVSILRYREALGYQKEVEFERSVDAYGLAHAFQVTRLCPPDDLDCSF